MIEKLAQLEKTHAELTQRLADPALLADHKAYADTNRALAEIHHVVALYRDYTAARRHLAENEELLATLAKDDELFALAHEERDKLLGRIADLEELLRRELTPKDPNDARNVVLEIRGGTGGDEATLFAAELFRMYSRYEIGRAHV